MERLKAKCHELETPQLVEVAKEAAARRDDEGDIVLDACLTVLELRLPEADFIALCETFE